MKRLPSLKLIKERVQGRVLSRAFIRSTRRAFSFLFLESERTQGERSEVVGRAASHRGVIICSSFGRRVVGENRPAEETEREGG